ncbi:hypothetical protein RHGRI_012996 [Rhododendron griersonianum]|uniref:AAA ATPase AAA+ lid domain-containing protein n=1 Tax=Rhododendron griersonianum TaxID=479676 RepID=A0AAV6K4A7_9ERIC|nr:hypothetical protein RHGRI_012996 [Rhododendron griersonianum]
MNVMEISEGYILDRWKLAAKVSPSSSEGKVIGYEMDPKNHHPPLHLSPLRPASSTPAADDPLSPSTNHHHTAADPPAENRTLSRDAPRIMVGLPSVESWEIILKTLLGKEKVENLDFKELANMTEGFSRSDLKNLCITAAYLPVRELIQQERLKDLMYTTKACLLFLWLEIVGAKIWSLRNLNNLKPQPLMRPDPLPLRSLAKPSSPPELEQTAVEVEYANGDSAFVKVTYPWKPLRCSECHVFGHLEASHKMEPTVTGGSRVPILVTPNEQVTVLPSEESVEQAMVNPEGFGLKSTGVLGQYSHSPKLTSPAVGSLPRNSVVMTDGVASSWVGQHQGLVVKTPPPPGCHSPPKVSSGLSNTFAILQSIVFGDEQYMPGSTVGLHSGQEENKGLGSSVSTLDSTVPLVLPEDPAGLVPNSDAPSLSECVVLVTLAECGARSVEGVVSGHEEGSPTQPVPVPVVTKGPGAGRSSRRPPLVANAQRQSVKLFSCFRDLVKLNVLAP